MSWWFKGIQFWFREARPKTMVWELVSGASLQTLGVIRWHGPSRQYCFFPGPSTVFSKGCMGDIGAFIKDQMEARDEG